MRFYRTAFFAFFALLVFAQSSFAGDKVAVIPSINSGFTGFANAHLYLEKSQAVKYCSTLLEDESALGAEMHIQKKTPGYKKKYKRIFSPDYTLRPLVREIDNTFRNIYFEESYSKPHFILPLHRFLFRLTPF
jgi:hypothetical protein